MLVLLLLLASGSLALELKEPIYPYNVCAELEAELQEGPLGYLPESSESTPDTERIQEALNNCSGHHVKLVKGEGNAFLSGPLTMKKGVSLWIDEGVTLFASRNPRDFDKDPGTCGVLAASGSGCNPLITVKSNNSHIVGDGVIDGRGGQKMIGQDETWWELALRAKYDPENRNQNCPRLIVARSCENFTLYNIRLHNSPNFHFVAQAVDNLLVWGVKVDTPSPAYPDQPHARNTDAFDPNGNNMVFFDCYVNTGDDNIAIKGGSGPATNILIENCHFYKGHGMSIGSETNSGVTNVTVRNLAIIGADNGLRIKSDSTKGGVVSGIRYENICIANTSAPLVFDTYYSDMEGRLIPDFHDIQIVNAHIFSSDLRQVVFRGYNATYPLKIQLDNVVSEVSLFNITASDAEITFGPIEVTNIPLVTDDNVNVRVKNLSTRKAFPLDCSQMFVPFPR